MNFCSVGLGRKMYKTEHIYWMPKTLSINIIDSKAKGASNQLACADDEEERSTRDVRNWNWQKETP